MIHLWASNTQYNATFLQISSDEKTKKQPFLAWGYFIFFFTILIIGLIIPLKIQHTYCDVTVFDWLSDKAGVAPGNMQLLYKHYTCVYAVLLCS